MEAFVHSNEAYETVPNVYWEFSIFSSRFLLDFPFPNVFGFARILIKHFASWKHVTLSLCIQSHLQIRGASLVTSLSFPRHRQVSVLTDLLFGDFPQTQHVCMHIISESLRVHEDGVSPWERNDAREFLSSIPLLYMLFCCSTIFRLPGVPKVCPTPVCALSVNSLYWIKTLFLFFTFRTFTKSVRNKTSSTGQMEGRVRSSQERRYLPLFPVAHWGHVYSRAAISKQGPLMPTVLQEETCHKLPASHTELPAGTVFLPSSQTL